MDTQEAIRTRRAVKHFDAQHVMTDGEVQNILSLAVLSPTAFNIQNWRLVMVQDKALRQEIRDVAWGQEQVTDASLLFVICADLNAWKNQPERYWKNAPEDVQQFMIPAIDDYYRDKDQVQRDEAMRSCGLLAQTLMLTARSMGYDSCPMDGFDFDRVAEIIKLPDDHVIAMFVVIGKAITPARPRGGQLPLTDIVIKDRF